MSMPSRNWMFVVAAYTVTWIVLLGYAVRVHRALVRARAEHDAAIANAERAS
jgi:CcmD family protein